MNKLDLDTETFTLVVGASRAKVPVPSGGYGDHEIVVSPTGRYVLVFLSTGQSEESYELYDTSPKLRHIGGLPQVVGEGYAPVFSADERFIAHACATNPSLDGRGLVPWAELRVQDLTTLAITLCRVDVRMSSPLEGDVAYVEGLRFTPEGLTFVAPWGARATLPLPLPASIAVPGPSDQAADREVLTWEHAKRTQPAGIDRYAATHTYTEGDWLEHPKFGAGVVIEIVEGAKARVLFESGERVLVHAR